LAGSIVNTGVSSLSSCPNNGGRTTAAFYFINGRIVSLQATVLPANGDYDTPEMGRFVDSVTFFTVLAADDSIELPAPPK